MKKPIELLAESAPVQILLTLLIYAFYGAILGLCLFPPLALLLAAWAAIDPLAGGAGGVLLFALCLAACLYVFLIASVLVMGLAIRLISLGIKPGRYPQASPTMLRWLVYSGVYSIALVLVLPLIPMSFFSNLFFRLVGCRMGRNVRLNNKILNDAFLIEIGDDVTIGGNAEVSCHLYEDGFLILDRVRIGARCLIGANAYISPGVEIGEDSVVGLNTYIRRGKRLPPGSRFTTIGGMRMDRAAALEKGVAGRR